MSAEARNFVRRICKPAERLAVRRHPFEQANHFPRPRWPLTENLLSLLGAHGKLAEAVQRSIVTQKIFEHAGKKKHAAANELFFIEFHFDAMSAHKTYAVFGNDARKMTSAG